MTVLMLALPRVREAVKAPHRQLGERVELAATTQVTQEALRQEVWEQTDAAMTQAQTVLRITAAQTVAVTVVMLKKMRRGMLAVAVAVVATLVAVVVPVLRLARQAAVAVVAEHHILMATLLAQHLTLGVAQRQVMKVTLIAQVQLTVVVQERLTVTAVRATTAESLSNTTHR